MIRFLNSTEGDAAQKNKIKYKKVYHFVKSYGMGFDGRYKQLMYI